MKLHVLGEQCKHNITDDLDISSTVSSTMTWQVLQGLLPHLTKRRSMLTMSEESRDEATREPRWCEQYTLVTGCR